MLHALSGIAIARFALLEALESRTLLSTGPVGLQPAQVRHAYGLDVVSFTNSLGQTIKGDGAGQTIAIVNAFDAPNIMADLNAFDKSFSINGGSQTLYQQYGAAASFLTRKTTSTSTPADPGWLWALETAMDVEWAHSIAPKAKILLVEAASDSLGNLLNAVDIARKAAGVSVVSMSWGAGEFSTQGSYDSYFTTPAGHSPVTFVASSGDNGGGALWPSVSPNVISVGGSSLTLKSDNSYKSETAWSGSGGSISLYESKPSYQSSVTLSGATRSAPDVAYLADPYTGVAVYDSYKNGGWIEVGGTSAGSPQWAGLIAIANQERAGVGKSALDGRSQALPALYGMSAASYHDITSGANAYSATPGYDLVTGLGSPIANRLIPALQSASSAGIVSAAFAKPSGTTRLKTAARSQLALTSPTSAAPAEPTHLPVAWAIAPRWDGQPPIVPSEPVETDVTGSLLGRHTRNLFSSAPLIAA
jgi:subtilase family serine protease